MAQKGKKVTEKENVAKKENKKASIEHKSSFNVLPIAVALTVVLLSIKTYQCYVQMSAVPDLPRIDLNEWWGPSTTGVQDTSVRPFRVLFTEAMQEHLRKKFDIYRARTNRRKSLTADWKYGTNSEALARFFAYWQFQYNFRERVRYLNQFDQFKTNVQGLDIHFIHVKPKVNKNVKVFPLLLLHGWPGTFRDFFDVIPLLTKVRPGYDFAFEVIIPSLPGFTYSQATTKSGLNTFKISIIMRNLMHRLGFKQYYVHGQDFGHSIGSHMSTIFPKEVLGFHTSFPANFSKLSFITWVLGAIWPKFMGEGWERMYPLKEKVDFLLEESGYMHLQGSKPDTVGIALHDSPVGLAAYLLDRVMIFTDPANKLTEDGGLFFPDPTRTDTYKYYNNTAILDNVMLYWSTGSITTAMRLYKETIRSSDLEQDLAKIPTSVPTWSLRLKHELVHHPDFILKWKYTNLLGSTTLDFGGHFAALERPKELANDLFLSVKRFIEFAMK